MSPAHDLGLQYARAMGLRVAAVDITDDKLDLAREPGAELTVNAKSINGAPELESARAFARKMPPPPRRTDASMSPTSPPRGG